jgi:hypothetical protein
LDQRQEIVHKVLLEDVWSLVHHMLAHNHVKLSSLEGSDITVSEVVLHDLDDGSHLLNVIFELYQDGR